MARHDLEEASLFIAALQGGQPARNAYGESLRKMYVESEDIRLNLRTLERMQAVLGQAGLVFEDPNYVPGMSAQKLYVPGESGLAFPLAMSVFHSYYDSDVSSWASIEGRTACDKEYPDSAQAIAEYDRITEEMRTAGEYEQDISRTRRVFVRPASQPTEYWSVEIQDDHLWQRFGSFPLPAELWYSPPTQHRQWRKFSSCQER